MSYYDEISYHVKKTQRADGKIVWRAYENDNYLDEFMSEERAWAFIAAYARTMR